jgi:hypothetical protein
MMSNTNTQKKYPRILFLSIARMNGTIILRSFGQIPNSMIWNKIGTYFYHSMKGYHSWDFVNDEHTKQIDDIINKANEYSGPSFFHEVTGELNIFELDRLKENGFTVVLILRHPKKQFASFKKIRAEESYSQNIIREGWTNMNVYVNQNKIDFVIDSEKYLSNEVYRIRTVEKLGFQYRSEMATNMVRFLGEAFHNQCAITKKYDSPTKNIWNGPSGSSLSLHSDNSLEINESQLTKWEKLFLSQAIQIYENALKRTS